jgi:hypothetical protein
LFSGDEAVSTQRALKKLDEARIALLHKNEKGGRIAEIKKEREHLVQKLRDASENNKKIIILESSLADAKEKLEENILRRNELEIRVKYLEAEAAVRRFDNLNTLRAREAKLAAENKKLIDENTYCGFLPDSAYAARLKELDGELSRLRAEHESLVRERALHIAAEPDKAQLEDKIEHIRELGGKNEILQRIHDFRRRYTAQRTVSFVLFFLFIAVISGSVFLFLSANMMQSVIAAAAAVILLVTAFSLFVLSASLRRDADAVLDEFNAEDDNELADILDRSLSDEVRLKLHSDRLSEYSEKIDKSEKRISEIRSALDNQLKIWGHTDITDAIADAEAMFDMSQSGLRELEKCRAASLELSDMLSGLDEESVRMSYRTLSESYRALDENSEIAKMSPAALRTNYDFCCKQNASLTERCHLLENQLSALRAVTEKPAAISDRIYALDEELASSVRRHRAYVLACEKLAAAAEAMRSNITPNLSAESGRLLGAVTGGKYGELGIGTDMSMVYTVRNSGGGADTRSIDYMSAGTRDLAYISLRLALMDLVYRSSVPPVIFDESFARLDDRRLELTLRLIAEYAEKGHQVMLLTSQKRDAVIMGGIAHFCHIKL